MPKKKTPTSATLPLPFGAPPPPRPLSLRPMLPSSPIVPPPSPARVEEEKAKAKIAISRIEAKNPEVVAEARLIAMRIWRERGRVTATEVASCLRAGPLAAKYTAADPRVIGAVFNTSNSGWVQTGEWENTGSHGRRVPMWTRG